MIIFKQYSLALLVAVAGAHVSYSEYAFASASASSSSSSSINISATTTANRHHGYVRGRGGGGFKGREDTTIMAVRSTQFLFIVYIIFRYLIGILYLMTLSLSFLTHFYSKNYSPLGFEVEVMEESNGAPPPSSGTLLVQGAEAVLDSDTTLPIAKAVRGDVEMAMEENHPRPLTTSFKKWDDLLPYSRRLQQKSWVEIDVKKGGADNDNFGTPSCLSDNGLTLAVGAVNSDPNSQDSGSVHVYKRGSNGLFTKPGPNIPGKLGGSLFGWAVSLSDNGVVLAVGAPGEFAGIGTVRLYTENGLQYNEFPPISTMLGTSLSDGFGYSVSLSGDGKWLAVGAPGGGYVQVYQVSADAGSSTPFPENPPTPTIRPIPLIIGFGYSVSLSDNGIFLGVGTRPPNRGVQIYERKASSFDPIASISCFFANGEAVTFAGKSNIFAVRDPVAGGVKVYEINGGTCTDIHAGIVPIDHLHLHTCTPAHLHTCTTAPAPAPAHLNLHTCTCCTCTCIPAAPAAPAEPAAPSLPPRNELLFSLNADGKVLAIADTPVFGGKVWVYDLEPPTNGQIQGEYKQRGSFINVLESTSVSLADTGDLVAIGARFRQGAGGREDIGHSFIYEWKLQTSAPTTTPTPVSSSYKYDTNFSVKKRLLRLASL